MHAMVREVGRCVSRFILLYWICFTFPFPLDLVGLPFAFAGEEDQPAWMKAAGDGFTAAYSWIGKQKDDACVWAGRRALGVEVIIQPTGSGDTMRAYVGVALAAAIAAVAAPLWTVAVRLVRGKWPESDPDARLHVIVRVLVRFFLCEMFLGYGFAKVFPVQFAGPSPMRLAQPLGQMSPMGLLWTFMGFSPPYQMFTGAVEVVAGILLTTRRTTLLGSLVGLAAMTQIFLLNMCFDVPVKLYSFHYLMMTATLLAPDLPRLARVFLFGEAVPAMALPRLFRRTGLDRASRAFRTLLVIAMILGQALGSYEQWGRVNAGDAAPVAGLWEPVSMEVDGKEPDESDPMRWRSLDFSSRRILRLAGPKPPNLGYSVTWEPAARTFTLTRFNRPEWSATFHYSSPEADRLELEGSMDGKAIRATLRRAAEKEHELTSRGFHWIQEMPYNR
ncbi:hypothetical protein OJF2_31720 [Aquisphaera giovannonii]|uniref:DoxX n=1 Tax=Aquisphaera giovannonii TaxID=406548 RepID=A0A5B9W3G3_9BACT|nr:hypothetical protein [Aquisphaera giovannonii]QEH34631.1 hypothetical protein OJF2_31720 [Aquisphaera giovannonii]